MVSEVVTVNIEESGAEKSTSQTYVEKVVKPKEKRKVRLIRNNNVKN